MILLKRIPKNIRHYLGLNATQLDTIRGNWNDKTLVKVPTIPFENDPTDMSQIHDYHKLTMQTYTKRIRSNSQPRSILAKFAAKEPNKLIAMQGWVIDANFKDQTRPRILLAQPMINSFEPFFHQIIVDTHMWLPIGKVAAIDTKSDICPTVKYSHIVDIHQGDLLLFSAGIGTYQSHGKLKYGFDAINITGCGLPITDFSQPTGYRLADDYDLTSHLVSLVNIPGEDDANRQKDISAKAFRDLFNQSYLHITRFPKPHYWDYFDKKED